MVLLSDVVYYIILLDAIGAFDVVIWMIVWFMHNDSRYEPHHWTMWVLQEDRENTAMRLQKLNSVHLGSVCLSDEMKPTQS